MGSLISGIIGIAGIALVLIIGVHIESEIRAGEREGIINRGYVGEDDEA